MVTPIKMPDMNASVDMIKIVRLLKNEGEFIKRGESLCEIETDKAVIELESVAEGTVLRWQVKEDDEIEQGTIIAYIGEKGEAIPSGKTIVADAKKRASAATSGQMPKGVERGIPIMIRNLAERMGVDIGRIKGSGSGGQITREDVLNAQKNGNENTPAVSLTGNQKVVAHRVSISQREIPPIHLVARIDMSAAVSLRKKQIKESTSNISFDAILIFAVSRVIKEFPHFQLRMDGDKVSRNAEINIGCAVDVNENLYAPVIREANKKSLADIAAELKKLVEKTEKGTLSAQDMADACFTLSNLGMYPVESFTVIIPPGQSAGLSVGAITMEPVWKDGFTAAVPTLRITLSVDHRLINGREAARFIVRLKETIEKEIK
jgi:pyruvate dehydrogenase E2 component (dihydrolipoamide acetyltransferase)